MTETEYEQKLERVAELMDRIISETKSPEGLELSRLIDEIVEYEEENHPIPMPSVEAAVRFRMDQMGYEIADLNAATCIPTNRIKAILAGEHPTESEIKALVGIGVPDNVFFKDTGIISE